MSYPYHGTFLLEAYFCKVLFWTVDIRMSFQNVKAKQSAKAHNLETSCFI